MLRERACRLVICAWLMIAASVRAQDPVPVPGAAAEPPPMTQQRIDEFQAKVAAQTELGDTEKAQIAELVLQATADLKSAADAQTQALKAEQRAANIETEKAALEKAIAQPPEATTISSSLSISDLESEQVDVQARITQLEQELKLPTVDSAARTATRTTLRAQLTELPTKRDEIDQQLKEPAPETEPPLVTEARKLALAAQKQAIEARLSATRKELAAYEAADAINLPTLRREAYTRELNGRRKRLEAIKIEVNARRQAEAQQRAMQARQDAMHAQPLLKPILEENQKIAETEQRLRDQHEDDKLLLQVVENRLTEIEDDLTDARELDKDVGLEKRGIWLRKERDRLDDLPGLYEQVRERTDHATEVLFSYYEREDQLDGLTDLEAEADRLTSEAVHDGNVDQDTFREDALQVLRSQTVNLRKLVDEYADYTVTLAALSNATDKLRDEANQYTDFLDERILWVRSHLPMSVDSIRTGATALGEFLAWQMLVSATKSLGWDAATHPTMYCSVFLLFAYLFLRRARHGHQLQQVAQRAGGRVTVSMAPTIHCLVLTVLLAIVWPGLLLFVAWRLRESSISSTELQTAALNLMRLASLFFLLEFVRQSIRPKGLADAHFEWNGKTLRHVRRLLRSLMLIGLPIAAAAACLHQQEHGSRRDDIERLLFIASLVVLMIFSHRLFHPRRGALSQMKALQNGGWFDRLDYLWYTLGLAVPIALAVLTYLGYFDTAVRLALRVQRTAWLVVAAVYLHALIGRWLMLRHRRLRIEGARERLAAAQSSSGSSPESGGVSLPDVDTTRADIDASSQQSQRMLTTMLAVACLVGLWFVWIDVLPAIRFLDRWPIWETTVQSVELITDDTTGETQTRPRYEVHSVTIASLVQVLVIVLLTATAARNVPGLLEMSILARLPIDRSTAYAITSLTRYVLVLVGLVLAGQTLGLTWSSVQWLAAALTFGLGFGLQEIFANFVSGLIILFEQPVRVGDVVTIEGVSGVVNRIRIRATTIVDWDRKEYIVPNREFITGRLLNWTLSDKMNRVVINIGVAYGSSAPKVRDVIMKVLEAHPNVLDDPPPLVTFESFGESSLDFVARAYLPNLENRLPTIHDLHSEIHDQLAQAGIEIPFPQRDLHVRSSITIDDVNRAASGSGSNGQSQPAESTSDNVP